MKVNSLPPVPTDDTAIGRVFGTPIERDGTTVIPVAWVVGGGGWGRGPKGAGGADDDDAPGGGGSGQVSWPLGVYVVRDGDVRWVPALDVTRLAIAGAGLLKLLLSLRLRRR